MGFSNLPISTLAGRIAMIRREVYGDDPQGLTALADDLSVPEQTWANFEAGVMIPGGLLLAFLVTTRANPTWLMSGIGDRYLPRLEPDARPDSEIQDKVD